MPSRVWSRFQAMRSDGSTVNLRIQDLPKSRIDEAVDLFIKYFIKEETFSKAAGVAHNPQAVEEGLDDTIKAMNNPAFHFTICCEDHESNEDAQILGVSAMSIVSADSEQFNETKQVTKEYRKCAKLLRDTYSFLYTSMNELRIGHFYDDIYLIVHPQFRKIGIATEFFKAKCLACMEHNIPAKGAVMTSIGTQKIAEKLGWETVQEINLEELGRRHGVTFDGDVAKVMIWKNPQYKRV